MTNINLHMKFNHFAKKFAEKPLHSLRIGHNDHLLFLTCIGKRTLGQLGIEDKDVIIFEDVSALNATSSSKQTKAQKRGAKSNPKKKKKGGRAKQKNKPRQDIVIPQTEEEFRKKHSKALSPVLDQMEREKLQGIRTTLNNLTIKRTSAKERKAPSSQEEKGGCEPVFNPLTEGTGGKAGKVAFPVLVGEVSNLYKTGKSLSRRPLIIDLHGCSQADAMKLLDKGLPNWVDSAMKGEYPFVIPVDIICGAGNQILSEVVENWIRTNRQVANRPKGA